MTRRPTVTRSRAAALILGASLLVMLLGVTGISEMAALQKMAGYKAGKSSFGDAVEYLNNLRDSLIPLAIPLGAIGLTGGGVAYMVGNVMAQKILGGVVIGLALALLGPSLVA
jgi:hypothetical protein